MSAADGVDARARRVAARLLSSRSRRGAWSGPPRRGDGPGPTDPGFRAGVGHPAGAARLARALAALETDGWLTLSQVQRPGAGDGRRIDHVAVGPGGVVVVDSRPWVGRIEVSRGVVQQNGFWREPETAAVARTAGTVSALLAPSHRSAVHAFVCVAQHDLPEHVVAPGVHVVGVSGLGTALRALPHRLCPAQVHRVAAELRDTLVDGPAPDQLTTAQLDALPIGEPPPGAHREVAYVEPLLPGGPSVIFVPTAGSSLRSAARSAARRRRPSRPWWRNPWVLVPRALLIALLLVGAVLAGPGLVRAVAGGVGGEPPATVVPAATSVPEPPGPAQSVDVSGRT